MRKRKMGIYSTMNIFNTVNAGLLIVLLLCQMCRVSAMPSIRDKDDDGLYVSKRDASTFLRRTKRTLNEECREGCTVEEMDEAVIWVTEGDREQKNPEEIREYLEPNPQYCQQAGRRLNQETDCIRPEFCKLPWVKVGETNLCPGFLPPRFCCRNTAQSTTRTPNTTVAYEIGDTFACDESTKLDVFVILDASKEIRLKQLRDSKTVIKQFLDQFPIGQDKTRIGFLSFDKFGTLWACFFQNFTVHELKAFVDRVERGDPLSRVERGLQKVLNRALVEKNGDRSDVKNVVIVFTDKATGDPERLEKYATLMKNKADVYAVGMGDKLIDPSLTLIPSRPKNLYHLYRTGFTGRFLADTVCRDANRR